MQDEIEEWRPVVGAEGRYEVSSSGRVKSLLGQEAQMLTVSRNRQVALRYKKGEKKANPLVHRLVAEAFLGPQPPGHILYDRTFAKGPVRLSDLSYEPLAKPEPTACQRLEAEARFSVGSRTRGRITHVANTVGITRHQASKIAGTKHRVTTVK